MARKPKKTKNKPEKTNSKPKVTKKHEIKMFSCDEVLNNNKIILCDKGSGKVMPDLSKIKTMKSPNLKICMEKAGQLQYRQCSESEKQAAMVHNKKTEIKTEPTTQNTKAVEEVKPTTETSELEKQVDMTNNKKTETKTEPLIQDAETVEEVKPTSETKATVEACLAQLIEKNLICNHKTKDVIKADNLSATTFDFTLTDSDLITKCQTAILGLSTDFVTCTSLETSGEL